MKYSNMKELKEILTQNKFIKEPYEATFNFDEKFNEVTIQILLGDEVKYEKSCHILGVSALIKNITDEGYPILIKKVKYYDSTLPLEKIGKIQLEEEVILTDPCYTPNESRNNKIKVKPGTWNVSYAQLGIYSTRPEYLILSHESYTETPKRLTKLPLQSVLTLGSWELRMFQNMRIFIVVTQKHGMTLSAKKHIDTLKRNFHPVIKN